MKLGLVRLKATEVRGELDDIKKKYNTSALRYEFTEDQRRIPVLLVISALVSITILGYQIDCRLQIATPT